MINKLLIYSSLFFLFYDSFPFSKYHLGSPKALSIVFILLYFALNIFRIIKTKVLTMEKNIFIFFYFLIIVSLIKGNFVYESCSNSGKFIKEVIMFIIIYLAIKDAFIYSKVSLKEAIYATLYGYCFNNIFGIIELIYVRTGNNSILKFLDYFLNSTNHLQNGRVQFLFGEPSFVGTHITIVIIPLLLIAMNKKIKINMFIKVNLVLILFISFNSNSLRFIFDIAIGMVILYLTNDKKKNKKAIVAMIVLATLSAIMIPNIINRYSNNLVFMRIKNIINKESSIRDNSLWARLDYSLVGFYSIKDNPILGCGGGYYDREYKKNIANVDEYYAENKELLRNYDSDYLNSINMYARFTSEFGGIGVLFLVVFMIRMLKIKKTNIVQSCLIIIFYNWIQNDSFVLVHVISWICFIINGEKIYIRRVFNESNSSIDRNIRSIRM